MRAKRGMAPSLSMPNACTAGQASPPITAGAWNQAIRSTRSARSSDAAICAPPSTRTRVSPASPSALSAADWIDAGLGSGNLDQRGAEVGEGAPAVAGRCPSRISIQVGAVAAVAASVAVSGVRRWLSATTRTTGFGRKPGIAAGQFRIVRQYRADADHHRVVPAAQRVRRMPRAGSPVIHRLSPDRVAMRPSSVEASFSVTSGRPWLNPRTEPGQRLRRPRPAARLPRPQRRPPAVWRCLRRRRAGPDRAWRSPRAPCRRRPAHRCRAACGPSGSRAPA